MPEQCSAESSNPNCFVQIHNWANVGCLQGMSHDQTQPAASLQIKADVNCTYKIATHISLPIQHSHPKKPPPPSHKHGRTTCKPPVIFWLRITQNHRDTQQHFTAISALARIHLYRILDTRLRKGQETTDDLHFGVSCRRK